MNCVNSVKVEAFCTGLKCPVFGVTQQTSTASCLAGYFPTDKVYVA